ncbi:MAG: four helix bundle protein [Bacteroidales bacterium]|nr:four helix bundle protein [Bacteroidales bacterium]
MENQDQNVSFFRFEDLRVYGKATDYASWLCTALREANNEMERALFGQFCRSALNIGIVIAEGSSRNKTQFQNHLKNAKTSIRECVAFTEIAHKVGAITVESRNRSRELLMELTRMIGALIISLQRPAITRPSYSENEMNDFQEDPLDNIETDF